MPSVQISSQLIPMQLSEQPLVQERHSSRREQVRFNSTHGGTPIRQLTTRSFKNDSGRLVKKYTTTSIWPDGFVRNESFVQSSHLFSCVGTFRLPKLVATQSMQMTDSGLCSEDFLTSRDPYRYNDGVRVEVPHENGRSFFCGMAKVTGVVLPSREASNAEAAAV